METNNLKNIFYISIVFFYSIIINQYYGNLGLHSLDSTIGLSNGYRLTTGQTPFVDYWVSSGFLTDVIQSYFLKYLVSHGKFTFCMLQFLMHYLQLVFTFFIFSKFFKNSCFYIA